MISINDLQQISEKGISSAVIDYQLSKFKSGFAFADIISAASVGNGILFVTEDQVNGLLSLYEESSKDLNISRFIPASGAATRMFKSLYSLYDKLKDQTAERQHELIIADPEASVFFDSLKNFPFYKDLHRGTDELPSAILSRILGKEGLNYGALPKGLLKFHHYEEGSRTPFEEHLREAAGYCRSGNQVKIHFTISPAHQDAFSELEREVVPKLEEMLGVRYEITYSFQKQETDTIAVDMHNEPLRDASGRLVFRPGGHGALLENLNDIDSDIIFISNIDNVAPDKSKEIRIRYKKLLGGILMNLRKQIFKYLEELERDVHPDAFFEEMFHWMEDHMFLRVPAVIRNGTTGEKRSWAVSMLDRPIRVCGMVKNEGEPGGGPFFVRDKEGMITLQVVELSQINTGDEEKAKIVSEATHFNPVDLVCSIRRPDGSKYDLMEYRDPETGFISFKSVGGKEIKAQELPGLWNGSMAHWTTIFAEVPIITFTPVKTIMDLLRTEHQ